MLPTLLILVCVVAYIIKHYLDNKRYYQLGRKLPGPKPLPLVGNGLAFIKDASEVLAKTLAEWTSEQGITALWFGTKLLVFMSSPEHAQTCLSRQDLLSHGDELKFIKPLFGDGIAKRNDDEWKPMRKLISPIFRATHLELVLPILKKESQILVQRMQKQVGKASFDIYPYVSECSFNVIWEAVFGEELRCHEGEGLKVKNALCDAWNLITARTFHFWQHPDLIYKLSRDGKKHDQALEVLISAIEKRVKEKLEQVKADTSNANENQRRQKTFIAEMIRLGQWNVNELTGNIIGFIVAGHLNIAHTVSFVSVMLALHPEIQKKVYEEVKKLYDDKMEEEFGFQDLEKLTYLDVVIKETLRLYPLYPFTTRLAKDDIQMGDYVIPKGAIMVIDFFQIHRDPRYYKEFNKFNPDNFLPENISKRHPYAFIPFSAGLRNCVGFKYVMSSMKMILSSVLYNYKLQQHDYKMEDIQVKLELILSKKDGYVVELLEH